MPQRRTDALFSRVPRPDEQLAPQRRLGSLERSTQLPLKHSHLKKHTAVARATAGKVLASRCASVEITRGPRDGSGLGPLRMTRSAQDDSRSDTSHPTLPATV